MAKLFIDDDTTHDGNDRVMRAYWLAPRTTRSATVLALQSPAPRNVLAAPKTRLAHGPTRLA
jgi:hypothetical protein